MLGNGTWLNVGGNQGVTYGGANTSGLPGNGPYNDPDGGQSCVSMNMDLRLVYRSDFLFYFILF